MLEIIAIKNDNKEQVLDIFEDTSIDVVYENPFLLTDRIPVAGTLSFSVPPTQKNLQLFNFPERVPVMGVHSSVPGRIRHSGITILKGELLLINFIDDIQLQFKGSVENIDAKLQLNQIDMGEVDFEVDYPQTYSDLDYGSPVSPNPDWATYIQAAHDGSVATPPQEFCFAPVKKENTPWEGNKAIRGVLNSYLQYINFFNARQDSIAYYDPGFQLHGAIAAPKVHFPVVPFLPLHKILSAAFGSALQQNPFTQGDLASIVVIAANHPNDFTDFVYGHHIQSGDFGTEFIKPISDVPEGQTPENHSVYWKLKNFQQQYRFTEFLKEVLKAFGMTLFRGVNHIIEKDDDIFNRQVVIDWDHLLHGKPELTRRPPRDYILSFTGKIPEKKGGVLVFDTWQEAFDQARIGLPNEEINYKTNHSPQILTLKLQREGNYNGMSIPILQSTLAKTALGNDQPYQFDEQDIVIPAVRPLDMSIENYWWLSHLPDTSDYQPVEDNAMVRFHWFVPVIPETSPEDPPFIMFFAGRKPTLDFDDQEPPIVQTDRGEDVHPYLTNHNIDHNGNKLFDFSLQPEGTEGLQNTFHSLRKQWTETEKLKLKGEFVLKAKDIAAIDMRDKIHVRGKHFFIEKITLTLHHNYIEKANVELIES